MLGPRLHNIVCLLLVAAGLSLALFIALGGNHHG